MNDVKFDQSGAIPVFTYKDKEGNEEFFEYHPPFNKLWRDINYQDFKVELLINPLLKKESNLYSLYSTIGNKEERIGAVIPRNVLVSDEAIEPESLQNYVFVAYMELLKRLNEVKDSTDFSGNFEENICVAVFHLKTIGIDNPLHLCIHSLRKYGYCYFQPDNKILAPLGYKAESYLKTGQKKIHVEMQQPRLYSEPMVDMLLRAYPLASDMTHRFVLLYQIIEYLMEEVVRPEIMVEIHKLENNEIPHNDFLESMRNVNGERARIQCIFDRCKLSDSDCREFLDALTRLFALVGYSPSKQGAHNLFYAFRNQMTHSYRSLHQEKEELAITIQHFEKLILEIVERY